MQELERIYQAVINDEIARFFALIIVGILALSFLARMRPFSKLLSGFDRSGPALMTTIGVLGTFAGVFLGLLDFSVSEIDKSIPPLLEGLKIAFSTSIVGMGAAILLKIYQVVIPLPEDGRSEATPEMIYAVLESIKDSIEKSASDQQASLLDLRKAITSDSDTSLLTQVQKLRTTIQDGQNDLIKEFRDFAKTMAENNSKALIQALEEVIRDFNEKLTEQFGENFKQLNAAVKDLVEWQDRYRSHVEKLEKNFETALAAIEDTEATLAEIASHTATIPPTLEALSELLAGLKAATADLATHLEAVAALKDRAVQAFPVIDDNIKKLTEGFSKSVEDAAQGITTAVQRQTESIKQFESGFENSLKKLSEELAEVVEDTVGEIEEAVQSQTNSLQHLEKGFSGMVEKSEAAHTQFNSAMAAAFKEMQGSLTKAMDGHAGVIDASSKEMQKRINEAWSKTEEAIGKKIDALDKELQDELSRALKVLGQHMASISEKFAQDYTPVADRLKEVVQLARRVQ